MTENEKIHTHSQAQHRLLAEPLWPPKELVFFLRGESHSLPVWVSVMRPQQDVRAPDAHVKEGAEGRETARLTRTMMPIRLLS